ncbi:hypothetical protein RUM44_013574 [Polyplax serrata]|uniref:BLOC-2 complex member HPS3 N-terminal domain-containing protein n=1 Tax=Polyplax serrata TaxID=468196 RepID=A0ABR1BI64_POLSC
MVRVITVHNFQKQDITSVEEPISIAAVPPDILLLALSNNTIAVKDLQTSDVDYFIPTVDQVIAIVYSIQGNYIASLESKVTRSGTKVSYTRVYVNWEALKDSKDSFPMRARIAGRVTPLSQNQKGLEMIEIPNQYMPENISCCPVSGNLLVSSRNILSIYLFVTQTHDISKIHFIDFKQLTFDLHISFKPKRHQIVEDMVAVQNDEFVHVFRIKSAVPLCNVSDKEFCIDDEKATIKVQKSSKTTKVVNCDKLLKELEKLKFPLLAGSAEEIQKKIQKYNDSEESELSKLDPSSFPVRHEFPTILLEKSMSDFRGQDMFRQNPFLPASELRVEFVTNSTSAVNTKNQYKVINLCQYSLVPITLGSISNHDIQEKFISLILKPYYLNEEIEKKPKHHLLESEHYKNLKSIACFFGTQQEGYLHCFEYSTDGNEETITCDSYITYAFTAPVFDVKLDDCLLHAITEVGLETYTLRAAKHLLTTSDTTVCPPSSDPVCLIGLHPFVNVFRMCMTKNYLTLFANNEEASCTLYHLKSPDTLCTWKDFLAAADENKWEAPSTYCEMLGESHLITKTKLKTIQWVTKKDSSRNMLSYASMSKLENLEAVKSLYYESCALLGDYHILNRNYQVAYCYFSMSGFKIVDVIKRIRTLKDKIPQNKKQNYDEKEITKGLIYILKKKLSFYDQKYYDFVGNAEEFYNPEIGNLVASLMDLLEVEEKESISDLVLDSVVLREFSTDRILKILKTLLSKSSVPQDKDALSLALMCIQRDQCEQAKTVLLTMSEKQLEKLLRQYYDLLFASHNANGINMFTELSMILIEIYPKVLAAVLSELVIDKRLLSLSKVLKIFMDVIPTRGSRLKNSSCILQIVLESYFKQHNMNFQEKKLGHKTTEAMKLLIRIYLAQLQPTNGEQKDAEEDGSDILFSKYRPNYLNQVPPFGPTVKQLFCKNEEASDTDSKKEKTTLLKLQCILSLENLPAECLVEVRNFLTNQSNVFGALSLRILCATNIQEAISHLINFSPQPLGPFAREQIKEKDDWKFLVSELLKKIDEIKDDERLQFFYQQLLSEILHHIVENLNIEDVVDIIPNDYEEAERYFALAQNNAQANHLKTLIMITGKQLLASI